MALQRKGRTENTTAANKTRLIIDAIIQQWREEANRGCSHLRRIGRIGLDSCTAATRFPLSTKASRASPNLTALKEGECVISFTVAEGDKTDPSGEGKRKRGKLVRHTFSGTTACSHP